MGEHVLLVGMMGSGKSTVAPLVAQRLGRVWIDTDEEVERAAGMSIAEIFTSQGEASFRAQESLVLSKAVASEAPAVISVGGGAVLDPANRRVLRGQSVVVWLRASLESLLQRAEGGSHRPLLAGDLRAALTRIEEERRPLYSEAAGLVVDTDGLSPDVVAERVADSFLDHSGSAVDRGGPRR